MRSRKLLAFILCLVTGPALAGYMTLLGAGLGAIQPVAQATFTNSSYSTNLSNLTSIATFSRAGLATQFDSSGYLTYGPNNLLLNTATLGTQTVTVQVGVNYILSIKGTGSVTLTGASTAGPLNGTGVSNRVDLKITAATTSLTLTVAGSVTSARLSAVTYETAFRTQDDVDTTSAAYYGPRIDYDPNTLAVKGLLIEESRTNLVVNSNSFSSASWNKTNVTVSAGATGPDGVSASMWKLKTNAGTSILPIIYQLGTPGSNNYTQTVFASAGTASWLGISTNGGGASVDGAFFNLSNGTVGFTAAGVTATITPVGGGVYRCSTTKFLNPSFISMLEPHTANSQGAWSPAGTEYVNIYGVQFEQGSSATSYIPTGASAVTRAAETVQLTGTALSTLQGASGTAIVEVKDFSFGATTAAFIGANGSTNVPLYVAADASLRTTNGTNNINYPVAVTPSSATRAAIAWSASGRSLTYNGRTVSTDANAFTTGSITSAYLGVGNTGASWWLNGHIASVAFWSSRLPDATLQQKSVVGAPY